MRSSYPRKGMSSATLTQWLERLETLHPSAMELGLERVAEVAGKLRLLPLSVPVVTVAGTNGKGSTVAVLEALLLERGRSVGAFTSPHFQRFNERIRVGGREASDEEIVAAFAAIDAARAQTSLTYFEFAALAALLVFRQRQPDVVVLEVGLGGRLDAVNIVDPQIAVITSIDLDHQEWLGHTRADIAREKAGIIRRDRPLVIADSNPPQELMQCARTSGASPVLAIGRDFRVQVDKNTWQATLCRESGASRQLPPQPVGALLPENICAALQSALLLGEDFSESDLSAALERVAPTGRRQRRAQEGIDYILDVAHNPAAVDKLLEYMDLNPCNKKIFAFFSVMMDKDVRTMVRAAAGRFDAWFLADQPGNTRAAAAADIAAVLRDEGEHSISISKNLRQGFRRAQSAMSTGDRLVVFGSFHTVAHVLPLLGGGMAREEAGPVSE